MWELIYSQFHENKAPKTWLSAKITIRISQGDVVVNQADMVEDSNWRYYYDFMDYDKKKLYLIDVDGWSDDLDDRYQHIINELDSYKNKQDWKWSGWGWAIQKINTREIARDVRDFKESQARDGTIAKHIFDLDTQSILEAVESIEIPTIDLTETNENIEKQANIIKENIKDYTDDFKKINSTLENTNESIEKVWTIVWEKSDNLENKLKEVETNINNEIKNKEITQIDYSKIQSFYKEIDLKPIYEHINWLKSLITEAKKDIKGINTIDYNLIRSYIETNKKEIFQTVDTMKKSINNDIKNNDDIIINKIKELWETVEAIKELEKNIILNSNKEIKEFNETLHKKIAKYLIYIVKNLSQKQI